ncbi:MAG: DUF4280 domain-containing protein [Lachnospiraceae bacterium]|nr:DUF4280 domain-containing protein [Lachnospiraceae bacterium]MDE6941694.1 DUF4280 domain-containing protein [Lachnospiraceae bacterium]
MGRAKNGRNKAGTGDFIFENYKEQDSDKYEEKALELMCRHFEFYGQLNSPDIEYVTRGAKLSCTHGNRYIYLDAARDHGVYDGKNPVLTCKDCKKEENIKDFGACGNGKFEHCTVKRHHIRRRRLSTETDRNDMYAFPFCWESGGMVISIPEVS